ncbi:leucine-rich repeat domain-containing protein [Treponema saccharophilum]|uniref:Surface antigen BspA n=1 Tax=Treponema saccharophilum DSM 2985 TaxID=907348 RepID=H7EKG7_9SPIR|nr:leucine-rich repeat domain-containing protein [Treponema saccharophilum]EIC01872.1 hypothetical protein TresaDRAFT_1624 [Treponema saccharophilum DSM 2985]BDC97525.1 hypothetical protein TRSA_26240 [Treponema saccharophilum]
MQNTNEIEDAKRKKIASVNKIAAESLFSELVGRRIGSSFVILSANVSSVVTLLCSGKNNIIFRMGASGEKWMQKIEDTLDIISDQTKSGPEILDALESKKITVAKMPSSCADLRLPIKCDSEGNLRYFVKCSAEGRADPQTKRAEFFCCDEIGRCFCKSCTHLESVSVPDGTKIIGISAFGECSSLKTISFPDGLEQIEWFAFSKSALRSLFIPKSVQKISLSAFSECIFLEKLEYGGTKSDWEKINFDRNWSNNVPELSVHFGKRRKSE